MAGRSRSWQGAGVAQNHFDEAVAARYDLTEADMFAPAVLAPAVDFLTKQAGGGPVLELGIGTGRVALPLSQRGIQVHGIDLSPAMVDRLRAKPGSDAIEVTLGDISTTRVGRAFRLAYLVFNTIMNLTSQDEQVACFRNVADHLEPGGRFVIEVGVPQLQRLPPGETVRAFEVTASHLGFDEYDVSRQRLVSHHYLLHDQGADLRSFPFRYVWPAELDLMARLAGMSLRERWGGWRREPFTSDSTGHVSVWEVPAA